MWDRGKLKMRIAKHHNKINRTITNTSVTTEHKLGHKFD